MKADMGYGFFLCGVTAAEKEELESAAFAAEVEARADVMFGTVGAEARERKARLWALAVERGAKEICPSWYRGK